MRERIRLHATGPILLSAVLLSVPVSAALAEKLSPGQASGTFSLDGKTVTLRHAYAMVQPDTFDEKKSNTVILLTEKPLAETVFAGLKDLERAGRGQTNWILLTLDENNTPVREVVHHQALGDQSLQVSGMTSSDVYRGAWTAEKIDGSVRTKEEKKFFDHKYKTDAHFSATLRQAVRDEPLPDARTGKKLPAGGGEPGKAYLAFQEAVRKKDLAAIRKLKPVDMPDVSDEELRNMLELMAAMTPDKLTIVEGYAKGEAAVLYVTGIEEGQKRYATIRMSRVGGQWVSTKEKWSDQPEK
jgi:hypothetical protein